MSYEPFKYPIERAKRPRSFTLRLAAANSRDDEGLHRSSRRNAMVGGIDPNRIITSELGLSALRAELGRREENNPPRQLSNAVLAVTSLAVQLRRNQDPLRALNLLMQQGQNNSRGI